MRRMPAKRRRSFTTAGTKYSMRATFHHAALERRRPADVQKAIDQRDPSTIKLYDRRGYNYEKTASFFATY